MKKVYVLVVVMFAVLIMVLGATAIAAMTRPDVSDSNFSRIKKGMTMQEVKNIIGTPSVPPICFRFNDEIITRFEWMDWYEDEKMANIVIEFSGDHGHERLSSHNRSIVVQPPPSLSERLCAFLHGSNSDGDSATQN